ncbi:hypothetical protein D9M68_783930 [compost metagenome]
MAGWQVDLSNGFQGGNVLDFFLRCGLASGSYLICPGFAPKGASHFCPSGKSNQKRVDGPAGGHSYRSGRGISYGAWLRCRAGLPDALVRHGGWD